MTLRYKATRTFKLPPTGACQQANAIKTPEAFKQKATLQLYSTNALGRIEIQCTLRQLALSC